MAARARSITPLLFLCLSCRSEVERPLSAGPETTATISVVIPTPPPSPTPDPPAAPQGGSPAFSIPDPEKWDPVMDISDIEGSWDPGVTISTWKDTKSPYPWKLVLNQPGEQGRHAAFIGTCGIYDTPVKNPGNWVWYVGVCSGGTYGSNELVRIELSTRENQLKISLNGLGPIVTR